jgi:phosphate ABC transporter phosphate-binding protein
MRTHAVGVVGLVLLAGAAVTLSGCAAEGGGTRLEGGGSTFVGPMMDEWAKLYRTARKAEIDYTRGGSGKGISQMIAKHYDFGCTDAPMTETQLQEARDKGGEVVHIPLVLGAIVPAYNLKEVSEPLKFTGAVLADIYLGKITKWNDDALKALNPGVALPDRQIVVVRRADPSGSTFLWTTYLAKVSDPWKEHFQAKGTRAAGTEIEWPVGDGQRGTDAVASLIANTPGAIGYVELLFAMKNKDKMNFGSVRNQKGKDVRANSETVTAAAAAALADVPENLCLLLIDKEGENSYPICGATWAVLYVKQPPGKGRALVDFLHWIVHDGQKEVTKLDYAPLPEGLVALVDKKVETIQK